MKRQPLLPLLGRICCPILLSWICTPALLLTACGGGRHEAMLRQLEELERQNQADSVMTNDSLAEQLAGYFDRHGTSRERVRAHYILGRTYADLGEAPAALAAYQDAADCADTTAADCDWAKLSRVHAQSARIYHRLAQPNSLLEELSLAEHCAWLAHDTMVAIECRSQRADAYSLLHQPDSVIMAREQAAQMYRELGATRRAAIALSGTLGTLLDLNELERAEHYLHIYEDSSGRFDADGNVLRGGEIFYYLKGRYYLARNRLDSAEAMFRRLGREGHTLNHQIACAKGLQQLYSVARNSDSIAKYAELGYQLNDSAYSLSEMENIQRLKASYNYNRNKLLAEREHKRAVRKEKQNLGLLALLIAILSIAVYTYSQYRKRLKARQKAYNLKVEELEKTESDVVKLRTHAEYMRVVIDEARQSLQMQEEKTESLMQHEKDLHGTIAQKEEDVKRLQAELSRLRKVHQPSQESAEQRLKESPLYQVLHKKANAGNTLTAEEMSQMHRLAIEVAPNFYQFISDKEYALNKHEYDAAILFRMHLNASSIGAMLDISPSSVTKISKSLMKKLFHEEGNSKELAKRLAEFC